MPTNVTPEYKKAEAAYRAARDPSERLTLLKEMLRTIPKHKGTEHRQAEIKSRIKQLTAELSEGRKSGARSGPDLVIHPEGAAQVALVGAENTGKSALHVRLTGSHAQVGAYPFTSQYPTPGMLEYEDVSIQLVDLPAVSPEHPVAWIGNALEPADAALLVVDLSRAGCVEGAMAVHDALAERRVRLTAWDEEDDVREDGRDDDDPFGIVLPTLLLAAKSDVVDNLEEELDVFLELTGYRYPTLAVSAETGEGLDDLGRWLFEHLGIVRVYTKIPGEPPDLGRPFTVRKGQTAQDVALLVHRDFAASLKYARIWGSETFDGQQVGPDHEVVDGDILELHS
jgi:ribosome-interacting GTPase 1